jgi:hypothetical protein
LPVSKVLTLPEALANVVPPLLPMFTELKRTSDVLFATVTLRRSPASGVSIESSSASRRKVAVCIQRSTSRPVPEALP